MDHQQSLVTMASANLKQKCTLKGTFKRCKRPFSKGWQESQSSRGAGGGGSKEREGKLGASGCKVSRVQMGRNPVATTDLFSLGSGKEGGDSRRQAVHRKGRDCRRPGLTMQCPVTWDNGQVWRHSGLCSGGWGQGGSGTKWPRTLIEL